VVVVVVVFTHIRVVPPCITNKVKHFTTAIN
jgi:hypothetical protein